jgi:hypothetical protein
MSQNDKQEKKNKHINTLGNLGCAGIVVIAIALIILLIMSNRGTLGETAQSIGGIVLVTILVAILIGIIVLFIGGFRSMPKAKKEIQNKIEKQQKENPKEYTSHINEKTGDIVLVEFNQVGTNVSILDMGNLKQRWVVSKSSIQVFGKTNKIILFSQISSMNSNGRTLSLNIVGQSKIVRGLEEEGYPERVVSIPEEINYEATAIELVKKIEKRFADSINSPELKASKKLVNCSGCNAQVVISKGQIVQCEYCNRKVSENCK